MLPRGLGGQEVISAETSPFCLWCSDNAQSPAEQLLPVPSCLTFCREGGCGSARMTCVTLTAFGAADRSPGFPAPRPRPSASYLSLRPRMLAQGEETHQKRKRKRRETEPGPPILTNERSRPSHVTLPPTPVDVPCRSVGDVFYNNQRMTLPCLQPFMGPIILRLHSKHFHTGASRGSVPTCSPVPSGSVL